MVYIEVLKLSLPLFLIIFLGWLFRYLKVANESWVKVLNGFAYYLALPSFLIFSLQQIDFQKEVSILFLSIFLCVLTSLGFLAFLFFIPKIKISTKLGWFLTSTAGNTIYMGYPLTLFILGEEYLPWVAIFGTIYLVLPLLISIFAIQILSEEKEGLLKDTFDTLKNPLVFSVILGISLSFLNFKNLEAFQIIFKTLKILGVTASPLALFALGVFLKDYWSFKNLNKVYFPVIAKTLFFPLFTLILAKTLNFPLEYLPVLAIVSAVPTAITSFVIADKFKIEKEVVGEAILVSTLFSLFTFPFVFSLLSILNF